MTFSEKLDFLMNITKTTNSALALYTSLDASHISRLRRGARKPAKNENYLKTMATYFAKRCSEDYQRMALSDALKAVSNKNAPQTLLLFSDEDLGWMSEKG
jgi:hypothetical protein